MKKNSLLSIVLSFVIILLSLNPLFSQKLKTDDIPVAVLQSFDYEYFGVKKVVWTLEENQYVASFKSDNMQTKAYFSNTGDWVKSLMTISKKELPYAIIQYVEENFPEMIIAVANIQQKPEERTHYYLEVRPDGVGQKSSQLTFSDQGVLLTRQDPPGFAITEEVKSNVPKEKADDKSSKADKKVAEGKKVSEEISDSSIPPAVLKMLNKKAARRENLKWSRVDSFYVAKCKSQGKENEIYITPQGVWEKTYIILAEEAITGNMQKHLKQFYKGYRFAFAQKEVRADKKDKIYLEIYEKKNWKAKLKTTIIFDKTGKLIKTIDPDYELGATSKKTEDTDLDSYYQKHEKRSDKRDIIRLKDLPDDLQSYVSQNYPSYRYKSCEMEEDEDLGELYKIVIQGSGVDVASEVLYFNKKGQFIRSEKVEETDDVSSDNVSSDDGELSQSKIPESVISTFTSKYPRVIEPTWSKNEDGNYQVKFNSTRGKTMCVYNPEGSLLETYNALSTSNVTPAISSYLKKNAKKAKVIEYYSVRKADRKTYYQVIIQWKKTKETEALWFTNTGKFIE